MSHRLQVLIAEDLNQRIRKAAQRQQVSKGEWVRQAIAQALQRAGGSGESGADALTRLSALDGPTGDLDQMLMEIAAGRE